MSLATFDHAQVLPLGLRMSARMTAVGSALISPVPIDDALAARLGVVRWLLAPNLLHTKYLDAAQRRYPHAQVLAPRKLGRGAALEDGLPNELALTMIPIAGAPSVDEFVFFDAASRTLVVTDLVFHMLRPRGWVTNLVMHAVGCHDCLGMSRSWRFFARDRAALRESLERVLALPFETLVMAHGEIITTDARARLHEALRHALAK